MVRRKGLVYVSSTGPALAVIAWLLLPQVAGCGSAISEEQKVAIRKLQDLGGRVNFEKGGYDVDLTNTDVKNDDLARLKDIANIKQVNLNGTFIGDEGLVHLYGITTLQRLYINNSRVTPDGVQKFKQALPNVEVR